MTDKLPRSPRCPNSACNKILDGFTSLDEGAVPKKGDFSVCMYCTQLLQYDGYKFDKATNEILNRLSDQARRELEKLQVLVRSMKKRAQRKDSEFH